MSTEQTSMLDLEQVLYVFQRKHSLTGEWRTEGLAVLGRTLAHTELNKLKEEEPDEQFRAVQKEYANAYRQGWKEAMEFANQHGEIIHEIFDLVHSIHDTEVRLKKEKKRGKAK